ncbi:SAM-dependent methyltransferase [Campylobacter sp. CX2-8023-23]|uniref:SAM-dependent methyltransferase n=1 Tax=Campylobacter porcelli TaxID=1660073 RepID=UPI002E9B9F1F|nr:SAM-dependent methyltransferase [Campylobacter sp. CX2-8023-23]MEE3776308.1 SAM-dependent methyltransferase [Campylobacter sp. CX2-4080-23]
MKKELDQFYTKQEVALKLCKILKEKLNLDKYTFLEPSAGFGSFVNALRITFKEPKIEAIDLDPKSTHIKSQDFFTYQPKEQKIITIGNPPFGKRATLAIKFFNYASEFSDYIAFIVPLQFEKWSVQKNLNKDFKLIFTEILDPNSFIFGGKDCYIRCCFQIWTRLPSKIDLRLKEAPPTTHKDFEMWQYNNTIGARKYFNQKEYKWDFAVVRQGFYDYKHLILQEDDLNPKIQYIFFKAFDNKTKLNLKSLDFESLSRKNTTIPGFGKADVVAEYKRIFNE